MKKLRSKEFNCAADINDSIVIVPTFDNRKVHIEIRQADGKMLNVHLSLISAEQFALDVLELVNAMQEKPNPEPKLNTVKTDGFYMNLVEGGKNPQIKHNSFDKAEAEARRLAEMTGKKVTVLQPVLQLEHIPEPFKRVHFSFDELDF